MADGEEPLPRDASTSRTHGRDETAVVSRQRNPKLSLEGGHEVLCEGLGKREIGGDSRKPFLKRGKPSRKARDKCKRLSAHRCLARFGRRGSLKRNAINWESSEVSVEEVVGEVARLIRWQSAIA
jgi:hypothetical protein